MDLNRRAFLASLAAAPITAELLAAHGGPNTEERLIKEVTRAFVERSVIHVALSASTARFLGEIVEIVPPEHRSRYRVVSVELTSQFELMITIDEVVASDRGTLELSWN